MDLLALHAELANTTSSFGPNRHRAQEELGVAGPPPPPVPKIPPEILKLQRSLHNHFQVGTCERQWGKPCLRICMLMMYSIDGRKQVRVVLGV